ncbi:thiol reductant ABC exporter subunit CydC [Lacticaseibacillus porcinae]|uniref:thiol reductant ABC exporter subunit CydC n=1 Tax=Lacticaseibacillus porcinae TaxID=1123687 RepID=UPI000F7B0A93|nr:thiol reductant ABC exporter subunit CydC [Lacticaseibacillus porcinae]
MMPKTNWVRLAMQQYRKQALLAICLAAITAISAALLMFTSGYLIDFSARMPLFAAIYVPVVLTRLFGISRPVAQYLERLVSHNWVLHYTSVLRQKLFIKMKATTVRPVGEGMALLAEDVGKLQNYFLRSLLPTIVAAVLAVILSLLAGYFAWEDVLVMAMLLAVQLLVLPIIDKMRAAATIKAADQSLHDAYIGVNDAILGQRDWVLSHSEAGFVAVATASWRQYQHQHQQLVKHTQQRQLLSQLWFVLLPLVLLWWSSMHLTQSASLANWVAAVVLVIFPLAEPLMAGGEGVVSVVGDEAKFERLQALDNASLQATTLTPMPSTFQTLTLDHVGFIYPQAEHALLRSVSFAVHAGQKVAILGTSGVGKTTLLELLEGKLSPTSGDITLDQVPLSHYQNREQSLFSVLPQAPFLFNTSIKANLLLARPDATDDDLWQSLQKVQLADLVKALPQGLETPLQEAGLSLSGGEQQRVAIAQILLQQKPLVILDEPTVGLDPALERDLVQTIFTALKDRTVIWVTHHLQGVQAMDQVVFIADGHVLLQGTPQTLLKTNTYYQSLWQLDSGWQSWMHD